jgi:hypothetical protein
VTVLSAVSLFCAIAAAVLLSQREFYLKRPEET